ncbi:MAG: magnesium transporter [Candidatus Gracilibacteria bacterium]|jgi:magnesium transporter
MVSRKQKNTYHHLAAIHKMTNEVPVVPISYTLGQVYNYLLKNGNKFETVSYIYVVDKTKRLRGIVSAKEIYRLPRSTGVASLCEEKLFTVLPTDPQEKAADLALHNTIKTIPIVDGKGVFLGAITSDTILSILNKELREDIMHLGGIHKPHTDFDNILEIPLLKAVKHRLPWLVIGLIGGILAADIVGKFEHVLAQNIILATFIPLVVYMADAVGTQLEAFSIRDFAVFRQINILKYFFKQFLIVSILAIILSVILMIANFILHHDLWIAVVLGLSVIGAVMSSLLTGLLVPFLFRNLKLDPANTSGPIGTIIQDILSVAIYFAIASWLL